MNYRERWWRQAVPCLIVFGEFHLYFFFFIPGSRTGYLLYLDTLLLVAGILWMAVEYIRFKGYEMEKNRLLEQKDIICRIMTDFDNKEIAEHDVQVVEEQMNRQFQENCDLQDYVAKWCHEVKVPLAAALLMNEKISDRALKMPMREQLERINQLLGSMLLGCKLQGSLFDLQIRNVWLTECVRTSIHNNQFFLIQKGFDLTVEVEQLAVYTDPEWLVYILDQLINNAIKYGQKEEQKETEEMAVEKSSPNLRIWTEQQKNTVTLWVEDHGVGIRDSDIRRIFEKGYTGTNYHNGKYKSTGMGLYMVSKIADRLGHEICVESQYGSGAKFGVKVRMDRSE